MNLVDKVISPNMSDADAMELAYGLLWVVGCDRSTPNGQALYLARKALYERMDKARQGRGITAAREALKAQPPLTSRRFLRDEIF